jgi:hypothetical protein
MDGGEFSYFYCGYFQLFSIGTIEVWSDMISSMHFELPILFLLFYFSWSYNGYYISNWNYGKVIQALRIHFKSPPPTRK